MGPSDPKKMLDELVEALAALEHERWAHWQSHMHRTGERHPDGSIVLPPHLVKRWERQIATPYSQLTEKEKESDRDQVRRYLPIIAAVLGCKSLG